MLDSFVLLGMTKCRYYYKRCKSKSPEIRAGNAAVRATDENIFVEVKFPVAIVCVQKNLIRFASGRRAEEWHRDILKTSRVKSAGSKNAAIAVADADPSHISKRERQYFNFHSRRLVFHSHRFAVP